MGRWSVAGSGAMHVTDEAGANTSRLQLQRSGLQRAPLVFPKGNQPSTPTSTCPADGRRDEVNGG